MSEPQAEPPTTAAADEQGAQEPATKKQKTDADAPVLPAGKQAGRQGQMGPQGMGALGIGRRRWCGPAPAHRTRQASHLWMLRVLQGSGLEPVQGQHHGNQAQMHSGVPPLCVQAWTTTQRCGRCLTTWLSLETMNWTHQRCGCKGLAQHLRPTAWSARVLQYFSRTPLRRGYTQRF